MKTTKIFLLALAAFSFVACDKHDPFDDILITGDVGPQAYWTVGSSMVSAGSRMTFEAQYYTSVAGRTIDRSEVWYNLTETLDKTVNCPWVSTFAYTISSVTSEEKRVSQMIEAYPHSESYWNDSLHAYFFKGDFPVSSTLKPFQWAKPVITEDGLDEGRVAEYFGETFMKGFKDSLETKMQYADYQKMFLGLGIRDNFKEWTDSTYDKNSASWKYHFKWNADSTATPVPAKVTALYRDSISFADLITNAAENCYDISYTRTYAIRALLRVYDSEGVYGITVAKDIEIN